MKRRKSTFFLHIDLSETIAEVKDKLQELIEKVICCLYQLSTSLNGRLKALRRSSWITKVEKADENGLKDVVCMSSGGEQKQYALLCMSQEDWACRDSQG